MTAITEINKNIETRGNRAPVLFIVNGLGIGGSERKTVTIVNELFKAGWNVHLAYLTARRAGLERLNKDVPLIYLGRTGKISPHAVRTLRSYIRDKSISRILCINLYPLLYVNLAILLLPKVQRPSVFLSVNTTKFIGLKANIQMFVYRPMIRRVATVVFGCEAQLKMWCDRYKLGRERCEVIYNGVDENRFRPEFDAKSVGHSPVSISFEDTDFVIGAIGQLRLEKNHIELIDLMTRLRKEYPHVRLVIVGHGPERSALDKVVEASGCRDRIVLLGQVSDIRAVLERLDVFVLPSISETFSNAVLEAMATQTPVILSDTGGSREMVRHGYDGYIYEQGNVDELQSLVERLVNDRQLRDALGKTARATILERFTIAKMIREYQRLLS